MKKIFIVLLSALSINANAQESHFLPVQEKGMTSVDQITPIDLVRVKVFPHDGKYATPQGVETRMDQATLTSEGSCNLMGPSGTKTGSNFTLLVRDFTLGDGALECTAPVTIIREGAKSIRYNGTFTIHAEKGKLIVVNILPFVDYLKGVIPSEMPTSWPLESLKAQAIAARTYAINQILQERRRFPNRFFDLDDTVQYQAYMGLNLEHPNSNRAVVETDELYLTDANGKPIVAYFSADSGGYTESADNVWGATLSYTVSKPEVYDLSLVKSDWTQTLTLEQMETKLISRSVVSKSFKLSGFEIVEWTSSGRMKRVKLMDQSAKEHIVTGEQFRYGLALRSSLLKVTDLGKNTFRLDGKGFGHGVGMSQHGARVLAESMGWDYRDILSFYYEGVQF